jgi:hypothetical protein
MHHPTFSMRRHIKARVSWLHCNRLRETVATDTYFANIRAIGGATCAQVFYDVKSHMINIFGMKLESEMPEAYMDFIHEEGASSILRRDNSQIQSSTRTMNSIINISSKMNLLNRVTHNETQLNSCHQISQGSLSSPIGLHWSPRKLLTPCL